MLMTHHTSLDDIKLWLGNAVTTMQAYRCRERLLAAGWDGFDTSDIPRDIFVEAAFRSVDKGV